MRAHNSPNETEHFTHHRMHACDCCIIQCTRERFAILSVHICCCWCCCRNNKACGSRNIQNCADAALATMHYGNKYWVHFTYLVFASLVFFRSLPSFHFVFHLVFVFILGECNIVQSSTLLFKIL